MAEIETLRDASLLNQIEKNYLLMLSRVNVDDERGERLSVALSLLTRAEQSLRDVTAQFLYLFTAVETLCGNEKAPESTKKKNSELHLRLKKRVDDDPELLPIVNSIKERLDLVTLSDRFKFYQERWGTELPQALREKDAHTMSCANLKRNSLVHRGEDTILFEDVMSLQSLVSRYVRMELGQSKKSPDWIVQTDEISLITLFDPRAAVEKWIRLFVQAKRQGQTLLISCLLELAQTLRFPDRFQEGRVLSYIGNWHFQMDDLENSLSTFLRSNEAFGDRLDPPGIGTQISVAENHRRIGEILCRQHKWIEAKKALESSVSEFNLAFSSSQEAKVNYIRDAIFARIELSSVHEKLGELQSANSVLEETLKDTDDYILENAPLSSEQINFTIDIKMTLCKFKLFKGKLREAMGLCLQAIRSLESLEPEFEEFSVLNSLWVYSRAVEIGNYLGEYQELLEFVAVAEQRRDSFLLSTDSFLVLVNGAGLSKLKALTLAQLGRNEESLECFQLSLEMYSRAIAVSEKSGAARFLMGLTYWHQALFYLEFGNKEFAKSAFRKASKAFEKASQIAPREANYLRYYGMSLYGLASLSDKSAAAEFSIKILSKAILAYSNTTEFLDLAEAYRYRGKAGALCNLSPPEEDLRISSELLEKEILSDPGNYIARDDLAQVSFELGKHFRPLCQLTARLEFQKTIQQLDHYLLEAPGSVPHLLRRCEAYNELSGLSEEPQRRIFYNMAAVDLAEVSVFAPENPKLIRLGTMLQAGLYRKS